MLDQTRVRNSLEDDRAVAGRDVEVGGGVGLRWRRRTL